MKKMCIFLLSLRLFICYFSLWFISEKKYDELVFILVVFLYYLFYFLIKLRFKNDLKKIKNIKKFMFI